MEVNSANSQLIMCDMRNITCNDVFSKKPRNKPVLGKCPGGLNPCLITTTGLAGLESLR